MTFDSYAGEQGDRGAPHAGAPSWVTLREPGAPYGPPKPRLLDRVRDAIRTRHMSPRTEACLPKLGRRQEAYVNTYPVHPEPVEGYIFFHGKRHPAEMGAAEVEAFLSALATDRRVAASTQNQALAALLFLYRDVLGVELPWLDGLVRAKRPQRLPVVLTRQEVSALLAQLEGVPWIMAMLLYGAGLRLGECLRLRVKDVDFSRNEITVRQGKGDKPALSPVEGDRVTMLPESVKAPLAAHLERVQRLHVRDLAAGFGRVQLPGALARKYVNANRDWGWQWVFPASKICAPPLKLRSASGRDPRFGEPQRYHIHESVLQKAIRAAARKAGVAKPVGPHTPLILSSEAYRRTLFCHRSAGGGLCDIRTVQELLGHKEVTTTMIYTHVLNRGGRGVVSPADRL